MLVHLKKLMHDEIVASWHMLHCLKFKGTISQCMSSSHTATVMCAYKKHTCTHSQHFGLLV